MFTLKRFKERQRRKKADNQERRIVEAAQKRADEATRHIVRKRKEKENEKT